MAFHNMAIVSAVGYATQLHYRTQATGQVASRALLPSGRKEQRMAESFDGS